MLKSSMQKKPQSVATQFNAFFTPRVLVLIIGFLIGMIMMKAMGYY